MTFTLSSYKSELICYNAASHRNYRSICNVSTVVALLIQNLWVSRCHDPRERLLLHQHQHCSITVNYPVIVGIILAIRNTSMVCLYTQCLHCAAQTHLQVSK